MMRKISTAVSILRILIYLLFMNILFDIFIPGNSIQAVDKYIVNVFYGMTTKIYHKKTNNDDKSLLG